MSKGRTPASGLDSESPLAGAPAGPSLLMLDQSHLTAVLYHDTVLFTCKSRRGRSVSAPYVSTLAQLEYSTERMFSTAAYSYETLITTPYSNAMIVVPA
jgi:hypothetical protein